MNDKIKKFSKGILQPIVLTDKLGQPKVIGGETRFESIYKAVLPVVLHNMQVTGTTEDMIQQAAVNTAMEITTRSMEAIHAALSDPEAPAAPNMKIVQP